MLVIACIIATAIVCTWLTAMVCIGARSFAVERALKCSAEWQRRARRAEAREQARIEHEDQHV